MNIYTKLYIYGDDEKTYRMNVKYIIYKMDL